jgi:fumarate hydratase subunit beta
MNSITMPLNAISMKKLRPGLQVCLKGFIFAGRDAALPKLVTLVKEGRLDEYGINLQGMAIFHTAVSGAGIGPTSSNKFDIESNIVELSKAGIRMHIGKGSLKPETIAEMSRYGAVFAVTPPLSALLSSTVISQRVLAFPELGMEALHLLEVKDFPVIIAAAQGKSLDPGKCFKRGN